MKKQPRSWKVFAGVLVLVAMLGAVVKSSLAGPPSAPRDADVKTASRESKPPVGTRDERTVVPTGSFVAGNGVIEPRERETRVGASTAGRIAQVMAREGTFVKAGEVLLELESGPEQAAVRSAQADVKQRESDVHQAEAEARQADAELSRALHGNRREDIDAATAEAESARVRADQSRDTLERNESLRATGAVTEDELARARRQMQIDAAAFRTADARRRAALAGLRREDIAVARAKLESANARVESAKAQVESAKARVAQAEANVDRLRVRAPIEGEVLQVKVRAGEYCNPSDALVVMGDTRTMRARIDIDERDVGRVTVGSDAFVMVDAFPGKRFSAKVVEVAHRMGRKNVRTDDPTERIDTKVLEVVVELESPSGLLVGQRVVGYVTARDQTATP